MRQTNNSSQKNIETMTKDAFSFVNSISLMLDNDKRETVSRTFDLSNKVCSSYREYLYTAPYYINIFAKLNLLEPQTSSIISAILYQTYKGRYDILLSFVETFLPKNFPIDLIQSPEIICEFRHIDICIKESGRYAIIIENKSRGAGFQQRQIARYIETLKLEGFNDEQIYVVIMPPNKEYDTDVSCIWHKEIKHCRTCQNMLREECDDGEDYRSQYKERYTDVPLYPVFFNWLKNLEIRKEDISLKQAIQLLTEYIYYLQTNNKSIEDMMKIEDIIRAELNIGKDSMSDFSKLREKLIELDEVLEGLKTLIPETAQKNFPFYEKELSQKYPDNDVLQRYVGSDKTVGVNIKISRTKIYVFVGVDETSIFVGASPIEGAHKKDEISTAIKEKVKPLRNHYDKNNDYYFWSFLDNDEEPMEVLSRLIDLLQN